MKKDLFELKINNTVVGEFHMNYCMDYDIDLKMRVIVEEAEYYLINFNHLGDADFYAIYQENNLKDDTVNYYLIDTELNELFQVPSFVKINDYVDLIGDYLNNREKIIENTKKESA